MDFETARTKMVDNQIRTTDVTSHSILTAFLSVPREAFVPDRLKPLAYIDTDMEVLPAASGQPPRYVMQASPLAKLLQLAGVTRDDSVLVVGSAEGYAAAVLSLVAGSVVALESDEALAAHSAQTLASLGYANVSVVRGDLEQGNRAGAPYDLIFVNGAVEEIPSALLDQLAERGRLVAVEGYGNASRAVVVTRERGAFSEAYYFNTAVKPLPGFRKAKEFVF
ncbi:protein-L-isoaspartate O-methyltransferase [Rhizobium sp. YJ-22]|uniref:protein-L-isoaspartate O-methyltransferase family protein n=1 Tax=Rhizobium sp. YJ-22 TaxID=3037556 RepID=UPI00241293D3|nr:protein-L-isoaspartate O-methyltransferase [Rhizobium sp. YJ-22]MDG3578661.1 protein-L-isoaspartate O-methyltransferase [Rhizobium sp. YJ-22]